jgi:hypothetical protein
MSEAPVFQAMTILDDSVPTVQVIGLKTPTTTLDVPALPTMLEVPAKKIFTPLDSTASSLTSDVPVFQIMPDAPASTILDSPATIIFIAQAISHSGFRYTTRPLDLLPTSSQDFDSPAATGTPFSMAFGPSNPYDPGPSTASAYRSVTELTHLTFPAIANYALTDFLLTPPRSPSIVYIVS